MARAIFGLLVVSGTLAAALPSSAGTITSCGQTVSSPAVLAADLDCTGAPDPTIYLDGNELDLAGHTLGADVRCVPPSETAIGHCVVRGPGTVHGCVNARGNLAIEDATLTYAAGLCVGDISETNGAGGRSVSVRNSSISGYPQFCVLANTTDARISGSNIGPCGSNLEVLSYGKLRIEDSAMTGASLGRNGARLSNSTITGADEDTGIRTGDKGKLRIIDSTISGNANSAASAARVRLVRSELSGNCTGDWPLGCVDVYVGERITLTDSTCETSYCSKTDSSCGVCSAD